METLQTAYGMARKNNGAAGIDGVTFANIETSGMDKFLKEIQEELVTGSYLPLRSRKQDIPKGNGKTRTLSIPAIRDRVVQTALRLILEPIFESDFQEGSFGYRPKRTPHQGITRVESAILRDHTKVIDVDLSSYFDTIRHDILLNKMAKRINDDKIMRLIKLILKSTGKLGIPQGGTISPLFSNIYLNEVDKMLEKAKSVTSEGKYQHIEYVRFADDIVILVDGHYKWEWLQSATLKRLKQELDKLKVTLNEEKTKIVNLTKRESFSFVGYEFYRRRSLNGKWRPYSTPKMKARTSLLTKLKEVFRRFRSQPIERIINIINPIIRGWVNYFRYGDSSACFGYIQDWLEKKVRRHLMKARQWRGFGWKRWSRQWLYDGLGLYKDYRCKRL